MYCTNLRKVGGSVMLAVPPALLALLQIDAGTTVGVSVDAGKLVISPQLKPHYSLDELLAQCDPEAPISSEDQMWLDLSPTGFEL